MSSLRRAGPQDAAAIDAFLARFPATSMFLRSNLAHFGTCDEATPQGTTFFLADAGAGITAVFGMTNHGYLLAQAPEASAAQWAAFRDQIAGRTLVGMTGVPDQVQMCLRALDLADGPWQLFSDEPLYHLNIADLLPGPVPVRRATAADQPLLERWFAAYASDVGQTAPGAPPSEATKARLARLIDSPDLVLFEDEGTPVAMAAVNARLPDTVQIGGVFTPDGMRGNGYARKAVAGLLQQCQAEGVTQSVLFANGEAAARAYEAIGYRLIGQYRVAHLQAPKIIGEPS